MQAIQTPVPPAPERANHGQQTTFCVAASVYNEIMSQEGRIIPFEHRLQRHRLRTEAVEKAQVLLEEIYCRLMTAALNIASADTWYDWDQGVPEGTEMQFDGEMMAGCPDRAVQLIAGLLLTIEETDLAECEM